MGLPPANLVLFFLSAFVGLWGLSVAVRGARAGRAPGTRVCPQCGGSMLGVEGRRCPGCEFEAASEEDLQERVAAQGVVCVGLVAIVAGVVLVPFALVVRSWETPLDAESLHPLHAVFAGVGAFGLALAAWGWRGEPARGRRRCPRCWYDMSRLRGAAGETVLICPECGHDAGSERRLYRARRRRWTMRVGVMLALIGWFGQTVPRGLREGWLGLVPTTVLIAGAEWLPTSWYERSPSPFSGLMDMRLDQGWGWQGRWNSHRMRAIAMRSTDPARLSIALSLLQPAGDSRDAKLIERVLRLLADRSVSGWTQAQEAKCDIGLTVFWRSAYREWHSLGSTSLMNDLWRAKTVTCVTYASIMLQAPLAEANAQTLPLIWDCALSSPDEQAVSMAGDGILYLAEWDPAALADWLEHSRSTEASVRLAAACAAGEGRHELEAVGVRLREMVTRDAEPPVNAAAVEALVKSECVDQATWLPEAERVLFGTTAERWRITQALLPPYSHEPNEARINLLIRAADDADPAVRAAALWTLATFWVNHSWYHDYPVEPSWRAVVGRLNDGDPRVRLLAAKAVTMLSDQWSARFDRLFPDDVAKARLNTTTDIVFDPASFP